MQRIMPILVTTLLLMLSITEGAVLLNSEVFGTSTHPDNPCPGDRVVYTCTTTDDVLTWRVGGTVVGTYVSATDDVDETREIPALSGVIANLTAEDGMILTSTLTIPPAGSVVANETSISCTDFAGIRNSTVLHIIGSPSAPGITVTLENITAVSITLTPPEYGTECLSEYVIEYDEFSTSIGTSTSTVISDLDLCFRNHIFTAFGVTPGVPNGTRSVPVSRGSAPDQVNVTRGASVGCPSQATVPLTWNPPSMIQECVANYTLETRVTVDTATVTSSDTTVTSSDTTVSINSGECCAEHSFTVTPVYALAGPGTTSNPVSVVPGQNAYPNPGNLSLDVMYNTAIDVTVHWQNAGEILGNFLEHNITVQVHIASNTLRNSGSAATMDTIMRLNYGSFMDNPVQVSVSFMTFFCTSSSSRSVTFPFIISGQPTVDPVGLNATFNVTFATIESSSVTFNVVSTAVVEVNVSSGGTLIQQNATSFPANFPRNRTAQILITNLQYDTPYNYTIRVLSTNASNAVVIPRMVTGNFRTGRPPVTVNIAAVVGGVVGGIVVAIIITIIIIIVVIALFVSKPKRKGQKDEDMELREPSPGSSPAADSGPPPAVYADPNTIQREEFPGTQDVYTVPDKKKKKQKPEDHLPTYQDPSTITHEVAPTGDMYAQPDKAKKPRGSKKNQQEAPPHTQEQLAEMYSQPDKSKKQQNQGLTYTHIDFHGSGKVPDTQPGVVYSDVKPQ